jgi:hypothetical protein
MNPKRLIPFTGTATTLVAAALAAHLVACSDLGEETRLALATQQAQTTPASAPPPGLLAADGSPRPSLPEAAPADPAVRTQGGHYALAEQAVALDFERRGDVVWVDPACCGLDAADSLREILKGLRASAEVSSDAPVLVKGADLRLAAHVVNRLEEEGERRVFLVTR